jgi:alpha-N-arabinofuranosidase
VQLFKSPARGSNTPELLASQKLSSSKPLFLKIEANADKYAFYFGEAKNKWTLLKDGVDGAFLSTKVAGGFVGSLFVMYGTSNGEATTSVASYDWFEYKGNDDVFKK